MGIEGGLLINLGPSGLMRCPCSSERFELGL